MYDLTCDTCGRSGTVDDGIEAGGPCQDPCLGTVYRITPIPDDEPENLRDFADQLHPSKLGLPWDHELLVMSAAECAALYAAGKIPWEEFSDVMNRLIKEEQNK